jgi:hypothetical protein
MGTFRILSRLIIRIRNRREEEINKSNKDIRYSGREERKNEAMIRNKIEDYSGREKLKLNHSELSENERKIRRKNKVKNWRKNICLGKN